MFGKYACHVFWSWNDLITREGIDRQLTQFYAAGIGGVVVHARAGLKIEYMSDEWLDLFAFAVEKAKALGMKVVIYDENGWPSGFAGGAVKALNPDFVMKKLVFSLGKPDFDEIIARYARTENGYVLSENGELYACVKRNNDYVDLTDRKVTEAFIALTHEKYKRKIGSEFGKTITAVFTDEPQYSSFDNFAYPYSSEIDGEFFAFARMDLNENLWRLYAEKSGAFKQKYLDFFAKRFCENYTCVVSEWCAQNGLEMTGHLSAEDGLVFEACGSGGVMPHYRAMQRPGIDFCGKRLASPVLLKQIESVKNQTDKEIILSESFGGAGWGATLEDYLRIWRYQAAFGVNQLCAHLSPYSVLGVRKRDYPGFFSEEQPWWGQARDFFGRIEELNELLSSGKCKNRIAVLQPLKKAMSQGNFSAEQKALSTEFRVLTENLIDCQLDFDYVEEDSLQTSTVADGKLHVGAGEYSVVLCLNDTLTEETEKFLRGVKLGVVGVDLFNRREAILRWFEEIGYVRKVELTDGVDLARELIVAYKEREDATALVYVFNRLKDTGRSLYLTTRYEGVTEVGANGQQRPVSTNMCENGYYCKVDIPANGAVTYILNGKKNTVKTGKRMVGDMLVEGFSLTEKNSLTLDRAAYSFDGIDYSAECDILSLSERIYEARKRDVYVRYEFINELSNKRELTLFVEGGYETIAVNGKEPKPSKEKFFSNKLIGYDITDCAVSGKNVIVMHFVLPLRQLPSKDWEFESFRNIYFLPIEPESIYIRGDFSVKCRTFEKTPLCMQAEMPFAIADTGAYDLQNITQSGAPFYRGTLHVHGEFSYTGGNVWFELTFFGSMASIYVNGEFAGNVFGKERFEATKHLKLGKNSLLVVVYSTNRNLLGAHHHYRGEVKMTGRNTFEGKRGFEDFVHANVAETTFTEKYSLIPFGFGELKIIQEIFPEER